MLLILSPSKTLDFQTTSTAGTPTQPEMLDESQTLIKKLQGYSPTRLSKLMDISDKLAALNVQRYKDFSLPFTPINARPALLAFKGDVYEPLEVEDYTKKDFAFAQSHVRILSGLYGLLRPLDLIQPYRLEMGTRLANPRGKDLYAFWGDRITKRLNEELAKEKSGVVINLASEEYFKAVRTNILSGRLLTIAFKEKQKDTLKVIGLFAKRARGLMTNYVIRNHIEAIDGLKDFKEEGYCFQPSYSSEQCWVFTR